MPGLERIVRGPNSVNGYTLALPDPLRLWLTTLIVVRIQANDSFTYLLSVNLNRLLFAVAEISSTWASFSLWIFCASSTFTRVSTAYARPIS